MPTEKKPTCIQKFHQAWTSGFFHITKGYSMDSNQILSDDKDLQVLLVDSIKIRRTNPRWWMAAILKNRKIAISP